MGEVGAEEMAVGGMGGWGVGWDGGAYCGVMIDTHCHLTFPDFSADIAGELAEGARLGVSGFITISTTTVDCLSALGIAERFTNVWCTSGVHPLHSDEGPHDWGNVLRVIGHPRCVAWGELGLDNHYPEPAKRVQMEVLEEQLGLIVNARGDGLDKPVVLHCREAFDELIPILRSSGIPGDRFVFHCFTAGVREARACLDFGAMVSFTGVVTYPNAGEVREAAGVVPMDRVLVETDAPFLSPLPHRGKRPCRPAWVRYTAERLAEVHGVSFEVFHEAVNRNTERFFGVRA